MTKQSKTRPAAAKRPQTPGLRRLETWKLEDAKARFSEVVRLAGTRGPQLVTVRGKDAAVILSPVEFERLCSKEKRQPLVDFLQQLRLGDIPLVRESDTGRDIDL
jgi:prevent-host-death family protein